MRTAIPVGFLPILPMDTGGDLRPPWLAVGLLWVVVIAIWVGFITTGQLPPIVIQTGHPTSLVFALDLSLVVPVLVLGAIWLWKRRPWGYVLAAIAKTIR